MKVYQLNKLAYHSNCFDLLTLGIFADYNLAHKYVRKIYPDYEAITPSTYELKMSDKYYLEIQEFDVIENEKDFCRLFSNPEKYSERVHNENSGSL